MRLADVVDLEAQLAQDEGIDREQLHARDRELVGAAGVVAARPAPAGSAAVSPGGETAGPAPGAAVPARPSLPTGRAAHELLSRWLAALREREPRRVFPGRRVESTLRGFTVGLALLGAGIGWSAAKVLLAYDGTEPVNVWNVLVAFVGVQLLLLAFLLLSFAFPVASIGIPFVGLVRAAFAGLWRRAALRVPQAEERRAVWARILSRLRSRQQLYAGVEAWSLLGLTQTFGVAFNVAALVTFLYLVVFTDLAFSWSTTLEVDPRTFHAIVDALATPWAAFVPSAVPSAALVEATRWSRLAGAYVTGAGTAATESVRAGGWWPFLMAALVTYGFLPRLVTLTIARLRRGWLLRRLPFDDLEARALLARLVSPVVSTQAGSREEGAPTGPVPLALPAGTLAGMRCDLVLWRDIPPDDLAAAVRAQLGAEVDAVHEAGGRDAGALARVIEALASGGKGRARDTREAPGATDEARDEAARGRALAEGEAPGRAHARGEEAPGRAPARAGAPGAVVVAVEAWEPPDAAVLEALATLRRGLGTRPLVVLLAGESGSEPAPDDVQVWSHRLGRLRDPHLGLEPVRGAAR